VVRLLDIGGYRTRCLRGVVTQEWVVNTLDEEGIEFSNLLTTNPKLEGGWVHGTGGEKARSICTSGGNVRAFNPDIAQKITLGTNWDGDFVAITEGADIVHALWLHREVGVSLVVLSKKTDFWLASDVYILSPFRYKVNQGG